MLDGFVGTYLGSLPCLSFHVSFDFDFAKPVGNNLVLRKRAFQSCVVALQNLLCIFLPCPFEHEAGHGVGNKKGQHRVNEYWPCNLVGDKADHA